MKTQQFLIALALGLGLTLALFWLLDDGLPIVHAAGFTVDITNDENNGSCTPGDCSLREAIIAANGNSQADTITLGNGAYVLTLTGTGEDAATTGDLDIAEALTITGAGPDATIIDASGLSDRVLHILASTTVISGVTIRNGSGVDQGGGILNEAALTLINSTVVNNSAHDGGGIFNNGGTMTLTNCTVSGNTADASGGGVKNDNGGLMRLINSTISDNSATTHDGGGIDNFRGGRVELTNSTVNGNSAGRDGGGVDNWGEDGPWGYSIVKCTNSTVSGNSAGFGGGIANQGTVQLTNCTISSNTAYTMGGGINNFFSRTVELTNTIVASQTIGVDCGWDPVTSFGCNLDSDGSCNFTAPCDITDTNPLLGQLKNNGGGTQTHALLTGSPAIDHIPNGVNGCGVVPLNKDQRGKTRPVDGDDNGTTACDIGAFEVQYRTYLPIILKCHYSVYYPHLDEVASEWGIYMEGSPMCGNPQNVEMSSPPYTDVYSPALQLAIAGGSPYGNCHYYRNLPSEPCAAQFTYSLHFWFTPTTTCNNKEGLSVIQALEFSMSKWYQSQRYEFALQWQNVGDGAPQWRFWCQNEWEPLNISQCLAGEEWHTLVLEGEIVDGQVHYQRFTIDQQSHNLNGICDPDFSTYPDKLAVAIQLDGTSTESPYKVFVDRVHLHWLQEVGKCCIRGTQ